MKTQILNQHAPIATPQTPAPPALAPRAIVFIVDDDLSIRRSLLRLLHANGYQAEAFAYAHDFLEYRAHFLANVGPTRSTAECLVLDICMPAMNGSELQDALARRHDLLPIVFITGHGDVKSSVQAMKKGAVDFLSKPFSQQDLINAIQIAISRGQELQQHQNQRGDAVRRLEALTGREREVLDHLAAGRMNKQIAADLGISVFTVKIHRSRVVEKLGGASMAELARLYDCARDVAVRQ